MCIRHKKFELLLTVLCLVACAVPVIVNGAIRDDYAYGRVHRSVDYLKMQRIAWPNLHDYVGIMEIYEEQALGERLDTNYKEILTEADKVPENLAMVFANRYENIAGIPAAKRAYEGLTGLTLVKGYGYWTGAVIRDEALYLFSPVAAGYVFLKQVPDTSVSLGLDGLFSESPALFKTYYLFSSAAGVLLVLLYLVRAVMERIAGEKSNGTALAITMVLIIVLVSLYATFVCVREYDYRNVLFMVMGWPAAVMALTERRKAL